MARHRSYSKRSRESRKAMGDGVDDKPETDEGAAQYWQAAADDPGLRPDPAS